MVKLFLSMSMTLGFLVSILSEEKDLRKRYRIPFLPIGAKKRRCPELVGSSHSAARLYFCFQWLTLPAL